MLLYVIHISIAVCLRRKKLMLCRPYMVKTSTRQKEQRLLIPSLYAVKRIRLAQYS